MPCERKGLRADGVSFAYGGRSVLHAVRLDLEPGTSVAVTGPNGSGKTTLLRLMAGALRARAGEVLLDGRPLGSLSPRCRARRIAVVPQHVDPSLTFQVEALVSMGRTPYRPLLGTPSTADRLAVRAALEATDTTALAERRFSELSGGEQQRVALAVALAQETDYLLLDEPTVHLDLHHQYVLLELILRLQHSRDLGILAVMHDLNLASLYFERIAVLNEGRLVAHGSPPEVLAQPAVMAVFRAPIAVVEHPQTGSPQVLLKRGG